MRDNLLNRSFSEAPARKDSRHALLQSAKSLFARDGFEGASVKEIADGAGVNVGLIGYYFGGKAGIYRECLAISGEQRLAAAKRILVPAASLMEFELRLRLFGEELLDSHLRDRDVTTIVQRECEKGGPEAEDIFRNTYLQIFQKLETFIKAAMKDGLLRQDLNPGIAALCFFGQLIHIVRFDSSNMKFFGKSMEQPEYRALYLAQIVSVFVKGAQNHDA